SYTADMQVPDALSVAVWEDSVAILSETTLSLSTLSPLGTWEVVAYKDLAQQNIPADTPLLMAYRDDMVVLIANKLIENENDGYTIYAYTVETSQDTVPQNTATPIVPVPVTVAVDVVIEGEGEEQTEILRVVTGSGGDDDTPNQLDIYQAIGINEGHPLTYFSSLSVPDDKWEGHSDQDVFCSSVDMVNGELAVLVSLGGEWC
ncbi:hypothetical protein KIPB_012359, partial [Kipferlia bialata]